MFDQRAVFLKKTPRQGIEPWFSDLESDVLTIERPRIGDILVDLSLKYNPHVVLKKLFVSRSLFILFFAALH
jgi:hypothetical protein